MPSRAINYKQRFKVCFSRLLTYNFIYFFKLFHQITFIVKSSSRIQYRHIKPTIFSSFYSIKNYSGRIASMCLLYNFHASPSPPFLNLLNRSRPKCISSSNNNLFPAILQFFRYFPNGCSFSNSIYTNNQKNVQLSIMQFQFCIIFIIINKFSL